MQAEEFIDQIFALYVKNKNSEMKGCEGKTLFYAYFIWFREIV